MAQYLLKNGAAVTTASPVPIATGTSIKTLLQFKPSATLSAKIIEYGISFDGSAAATPGIVELIETDVAATVTAFVAADIDKWDGLALNGGDPTTNLIQVGTTSSGFTASGEGSITAVRALHAPQLVAPSNQFIYQFPQGREPVVQIAKFARIRVKFGTTVNALCYMLVEL